MILINLFEIRKGYFENKPKNPTKNSEEASKKPTEEPKNYNLRKGDSLKIKLEPEGFNLYT